VERPKGDVQFELLDRSLERYAEVLREADAACLEQARSCCLERAQTLISIIECLVLELWDFDQPGKQLPPDQVERLFNTFATILRSASPLIDDSCQRNEALLVKVIEVWEGDVTPLIDAILPYGHLGSSRFDGPQAWALHERLSSRLLPKLAVLLNESAETLALASRAGFRCFTQVGEFKDYVDKEVLSETSA
jgi:hypothetical protein